MNTNIILLLDFAVLGESRALARSSPHSAASWRPSPCTPHAIATAPRSARSNDQIDWKVVEHACVASSTTWSVVCANSRAQLHVQRAEGGLARLLLLAAAQVGDTRLY